MVQHRIIKHGDCQVFDVVDLVTRRKVIDLLGADDQRQAMDKAKAGEAIDAKTCENPVQEHYELGQVMRISGTPALLLEGGELVPGCVPAHKLRQALDARRAQVGG